ncbi:MAG: HD domain-containing protein [Lachnospiraceae bacterium]|nr:HD domain-containing protein [Lachnospiraceae bacterium]
MKKLSESRALSNMSNHETITRSVYVLSLSDKENRTGKMQVNMQVKDGVSQESISIFDTDLKSLIDRYPFLQEDAIVRLRVTKNEPYFNAEKMIEQDTEEYDLQEIAERATSKPLEIYEYILKKVDEASSKRADSEHDSLSKLVRHIYEKRKDALLRSSSAVGYHHTGIGGNILHTGEVVNMCDCLLHTCIAKDVDRELLLAAAALHDVGKITCYSTSDIGKASFTLEGYAFGGHHMDSLRAIEDAVKGGNYDKERIMILENIIACHHGSREFGDLATPMTIEGYWLHAMDDLDAKHYEAKKVIKDLEPGESSAFQSLLKTYLYRRTDQVFEEKKT